MVSVVVTFLIVAWLGVGAAQAMMPTETVQKQVAQALEAIATTFPNGQLDGARRQQEIRRVADSLFDFTEMSRRALGRHWENRSPAEREEFVRLFTEVMARSYLGKIDRYAGESILYVGERVEGDLAAVESRVVTAKKSEVALEYQMHRVGDGRWLVYDVVIDHVSLVGTYRSQFNRIIQTGSFGDLLKRLREKERALVAD